jgi:hypothetical protein
MVNGKRLIEIAKFEQVSRLARFDAVANKI